MEKKSDRLQDKGFMPISQFARLCGISRETLIYYDKFGLLKPHFVNQENGYRYYTTEELNRFHSITILQDSGLSLAEIKSFLNEENPYKLVPLFEEMKTVLKEKERHYARLAAQVENTLAMMREAKEAPLFSPRLEHSERSIMAAMPTEDTRDTNEARIDIISRYYQYCMNNPSRSNFFRGGVISRQKIEKEITDSDYLDYLCIRLDGNLDEIDFENSTILVKPKGAYAVINCPGGLENTLKAIKYLQGYIKDHGLAICGNGYEFEILGTFTAEHEHNCIKQIEIQVEEK